MAHPIKNVPSTTRKHQEKQMVFHNLNGAFISEWAISNGFKESYFRLAIECVEPQLGIVSSGDEVSKKIGNHSLR